MMAVGATDKGRRRKDNQDNYFIDVRHDDRQAFLVVCDGMGGAKSGNVASDMSIHLFAAEVRKRQKPGMTVSYMRGIMEAAIGEANRLTFERANEDIDCAGMGSTMVSVMIDGSDACFLNVGDSRAYHITKNGITQVTCDHSIAQEMIRRGELTLEQARSHPAKNYITRAVGTEPEVEPEFFSRRVEPGDMILLCSDGLSNMVLDEEILFELHANPDMANCPHRLIQLANERGGPDNITVVLLAV